MEGARLCQRPADGVNDEPTGPKAVISTVLSAEDEAVVVAFRRHTLLPLDDCLSALQPSLPQLTRPTLHRPLQRHGLSRLPEGDGDKPASKRFASHPLGYVHVDIAEVRTAQGKLHLVVAVDRVAKFAFAELHEKATARIGGNLPRGRWSRRSPTASTPCSPTCASRSLIRASPAQRWTTSSRRLKQALAAGELFRVHAFDDACAQLDLEHRLIKLKHPHPVHPRANGQVERMNGTIKDATVKRFHYDSHDQLRRHLASFVDADNYARRLKTLQGMTLQGMTPYEAICRAWTKEPGRFTRKPQHQMPGLNILQAHPAELEARPLSLRRQPRKGDRPHHRGDQPHPQALHLDRYRKGHQDKARPEPSVRVSAIGICIRPHAVGCYFMSEAASPVVHPPPVARPIRCKALRHGSGCCRPSCIVGALHSRGGLGERRLAAVGALPTTGYGRNLPVWS